jgi:hypothetical protein
MKCITPDEGCAILQDISTQGFVAVTWVLGLSWTRHIGRGFFWPTAVSDIDSLVRQCEGCEFFAGQKYVSSQQLQTMPITWPFSTWV